MAALRGVVGQPKVDWYDWACKFLASKNLLVDRGYTFGHDWLYETIPAKVVARIKALAKEI